MFRFDGALPVYSFKIYRIVVFFFCFTLGLLGDMYLGHYRVIKYNLRVLWVSVIASDLLVAFGSSSI